jgi:DNA-binding helix-hairpin-helix protein with protein kinase domain
MSLTCRVASVPGFGPVLTQKLVDWRNTLEARFHQYRPSPKDIAALNSVTQKYARRQSELESKLVGEKLNLNMVVILCLKKREQVPRRLKALLEN